MSAVRVPYDVLRATAQAFDAQGGVIKRCLARANARNQQLLEGWDGVAEQEFMAQLASCRARMSRALAQLDELSTDVRETARIIEEHETLARAEIAHTIMADG